MPSQKHVYKPSEGHGLKHDPFNAIIAPRPIGWISTLSSNGTANIAPYSFFNAFNYSPPIIGFSSIGYKDTVRNIEDTGEFCWNLANQSLAEVMNVTSAAMSSETDEFELAGIEIAQSIVIKPPHVLASPVVMECKKTQIIQLQNHQGKECDSYLVLGEVVAVHIQKEMLLDGVFSLLKAQPILRAGGPGDYYKIDESNKFEMLRPLVKS